MKHSCLKNKITKKVNKFSVSIINILKWIPNTKYLIDTIRNLETKYLALFGSWFTNITLA